jgi:hypothetical protein
MPYNKPQLGPINPNYTPAVDGVGTYNPVFSGSTGITPTTGLASIQSGSTNPHGDYFATVNPNLANDLSTTSPQPTVPDNNSWSISDGLAAASLGVGIAGTLGNLYYADKNFQLNKDIAKANEARQNRAEESAVRKQSAFAKGVGGGATY